MAVATEVVARFTADISDVQSKMAGVRGAFDAVSDAASFSSSQIRNVGQTMADVGTKMTVGITLPLAGVAAAATNAAMSFETSMTKIIGLVGIAGDEVGRMGEEVLAMSGAVGKAPDELAAGLFVVTSAGLRGSEAMAVLGNSARAGAAGLGETNDIARAVAGALSAYGSDVLSAADATDAIVATARAGNFETSQFAAAIGRVLPFAQQAGASFQEMGGAVALLTRVNGDAAQSVTQIQALFRAFVVPTEEAKTALEEMGLSAQDLRDSIAKKGLPATLQMLDRALGGNREQLGRILGSSEAASAAFQILEADAATIAETFGVVSDSSGMTAEAFGAVANTTQFQVNQAMAELKATLIDLGNQFLPIVKSIMDFARAHLTAFNSLPGPVKTFITVMAGIVAVVGPLLLIVGKLIVVFSTLLGMMMKVKAIAALRAALAGVRGDLAATRTSMQATTSTMGAMKIAAQGAATAVVTSFRAIGTAAKGLLASLGPIGWTLAAAGAAFEIFAGNAAGTQNAVENLKNEIDETTGAMTEMGRQWMATELTTNISKEDLAMLSKYGITIGGFMDALEQGGPAIDEYRGKIDAMVSGQSGLIETFNGTRDSAITIARTLEGMIGYYDKSKAAAEAMALGQEAAATATTMTDASMAAAAKSASTMAYGMQAGRDAADELAAAAELAEQEIAQMRTEYETWLSVTSQISAVDAAAASIDNIGKASVEFGTNLMGQTPKARDFRGAVVQAFEDSARAAATLSDDLPTQRSIFTGELIKIVASLHKSGVKPKDIEAFLGAMDDLPASVSDIMRSAAKAVGDTDFKTEVEKAFDKSVKAGAPMTADAMERLAQGASNAAKSELGLTLEPELASIIKSGTTALRPTAFNNGQLTGKSIGSGLANGITTSSPIVQAAIARVIAQAKAAADAAAESNSPSRLFARTGDDIVAGLAMGITRSTRAGVTVMSAAARAFTRAFAAEFFPKGMGQAESAIANAIASADMKLKDAKEAVKQANKDLREAEKTLNKARRESIDAAKEQEKAERKLAKAQEELKNASGDDERKAAKQRVKQAEEDLANARRDANRTARDLAAAEGALARARREATEAADAAKLAAWVEANRKALDELQKIAATFDRIKEKTAVAQEGFAALGELVATPFGQPTEISEMFGSGANIDTVINGFFKIRDSVKQAYAVLTDASIVGEKAAKRNRAAMNATIAELQNLTAQAVQLREQHAAVMQEMKTLEEDYQKDVAETNAFYDAAEKKAEANIKAIEDRWAAAIPVLEKALASANDAFEKENGVLKGLIQERDQFVSGIKSGFRSFVNSLSFESKSATKQIVKETKRLANGITVTLERELEVGGGPAAIRETLQERLEAVRDFSRNIRTLMERGLDPALVRDFVTAGVDGAGEAAAALASGSQEDITAINSVQRELLSEAENFGKYASAQWHDIGIAQQQAIVGPLEVARDSAQKALNDANALRDQELAAARAHLDKLKADRAAALATLESEYNAKKADLEARATALQAQMDAVAAQIEAKIQEMVTKTATASAQAGQDAAQKLLDGFKKKYPGLYKEMNGLMTQLANSMNRTATIFVQTVYSAVNPVTPPPGTKVPKRALGGPVSARTAYLVGERGPELFVPGFAGNIIPNNQMGTVPAMGSRSSGGGAAVININVNAGMGANGDEIGRQIVDSLRKYERRNGPIPVKVAG